MWKYKTLCEGENLPKHEELQGQDLREEGQETVEVAAETRVPPQGHLLIPESAARRLEQSFWSPCRAGGQVRVWGLLSWAAGGGGADGNSTLRVGILRNYTLVERVGRN